MKRLVALCTVVATTLLSVTIATAKADPSSTGSWSAPFEMGGVAIHATLTHTGEVLFFQVVEGQAGVDRTSLVRVWDPATGQSADANLGYDRDVFCAGHNVLPDGRVFVSGGHDYTTGKKADGVGVAETDLYNPGDRQWTPAPLLSQKRWYPTNVGLGNGRTLIFGGQQQTGAPSSDVDSYDPVTNTVTKLPASATKTVGVYPRMHLLPNGNILDSGTGRTSSYFDPRTSQWSDGPQMLYGNRIDGTSVLLPGLDKVMAIGGQATSSSAATATAEILDTSQSDPHWRYTTPMNFPRIHANAVTLPDGQVLVVGGGAAGSFEGPVRAAELYDPVTETWTVMESQLAGRMYHSTALLLPDGRVLSAGQNSGAYATMGEIFSPPYLFKGPRPTIASAPSITDYGQSFTFTSPEASDISKVALIHAGSVTHSVDMDQRYVGLNFNVSGDTVTAVSPANGNVAPPGYYMLFAVNSQGVPSIAKWVQVGGTDPPGGVITLRGAATGVNAEEATLTIPVPPSSAGDLLLASVDVRQRPVITAPAGWTLLRTDTNGTFLRKATYWRMASTSEPASYTWQFPQARNAVGSILAYDGVSATAPIEASTGQGNASSRSISAPSLTTTSAGSLVVGLFSTVKQTAITPPPGMTERSEVGFAATVTAPITGQTADLTPDQAGPTGTKVATSDHAGRNIGQLVALTPA